ncbi:uncharacterized protein Z518_08164 [Rhinocladiella mackenziei CBS 650.93]|uniref:DUF7923 domain-containing protein n=1 Tax=Rhinocladiella mackenziei CBS 650.93 TaxID=1442369 RepID=A0A0D2J011_9EURO|nr:uncharacterized protein Z518_08164 [Rhinocladiella mackenziei CBS 650.93]KIX02225.1 hypothetical protein Z518_08164 [Rhinocladiella mackenziei CBS 650.93]
MPFSSWFSSWFSSIKLQPQADANEGHIKTEPSFSIEKMDFDAIADQVEALQHELSYAYELCEQANLQFDKYRVDIHELKTTLANERNAKANLQHQLTTERSHNVVLRTQIHQDKLELKRCRVIATQLQARLNAESDSLASMTKHARTMESRMVDAQFELDYLKCATKIEQPLHTPAAQNPDTPLPAQPFVVVLVDGDAYSVGDFTDGIPSPIADAFYFQWTPELFVTDNYISGRSETENPAPVAPGALAATRIRTEVNKYIMNQNGKIPIHSKIITRVFCNYSRFAGHFVSRLRRNSIGVYWKDFAVQFTEKTPLFDFFDVGRGKERADDKIRENFHLYLSTPNCHAIFVAACLDNGFARMLEQYNDHPVAWAKIVLVSPGFLALEIQKLKFRQVLWPSVFSVRTVPKDIAIRTEKGLHKEQSLVRRGHSTSMLENIGISRLLLDLIPRWNINDAMIRYSRGIGVRLKQLDVVAEDLSRAIDEEANEAID